MGANQWFKLFGCLGGVFASAKEKSYSFGAMAAYFSLVMPFSLSVWGYLPSLKIFVFSCSYFLFLHTLPVLKIFGGSLR